MNLFPNTIQIDPNASWLPPGLRDLPETVEFSFTFSRGERRRFRKHAPMKPSEWAAKHRVMTDGPLKGSKMDFELTPWLRGMMDASFFPSVRYIVNCKCVQSAGTTSIYSCLGYAMDRKPGTALVAYPDRDRCSKASRDRIRPMIEQSSVLNKLKTGDDDDMASMRINLSSMLVYMGWSGSATSLGDTPCMYVVKDEADKWKEFPAKNEASGHDLIDERVTVFPNDSKIWDNSTPTTETGHIWLALTTQTEFVFDYWVVCPDCGKKQIMIFKNITWPGGSSANPIEVLSHKLACYVCCGCGSQWDDLKRNFAARLGEWRGVPTPLWLDKHKELTEEGNHQAFDDSVELFRLLEQKRPEAIGFHPTAWFSYFVSLSKSANKFLVGQGGTPVAWRALRTFRNNYAAEPSKSVTLSSSEGAILETCCELKAQVVPQSAVALTCGIDVQKAGFYFVVRAWAADYTSWMIHYGQLSFWDDVEDLLFDTRYPVDGSEQSMRIIRCGLDTGGGKKTETMTMTEETYHWLRANQKGRGCRVFGCKGASRALASKMQLGKPFDKTPAGKPLKGGLQLVSIDTNQAKDTYHWRLQQAKDGGIQAAWLHDKTGKDYAQQILAEEKQLNEKNIEVWMQQHGRPNHWLDADCLAQSAADPEWPGGGIHLFAERKSKTKKGRRVLSPGVE